jgi:hypothetical protein
MLQDESDQSKREEKARKLNGGRLNDSELQRRKAALKAALAAK